MVHRIEVSYREQVKDVQARKLEKRIKTDFGIDVEETHVVDVYTIDAELDEHTLGILQGDAFVDPVIQKSISDDCTLFDADWVIEVGFKPGVTDNVGRTAKEVIEAITGNPFRDGEAVYTSRMYFLKGAPIRKRSCENRRRDAGEHAYQQVQI